MSRKKNQKNRKNKISSEKLGEKILSLSINHFMDGLLFVWLMFMTIIPINYQLFFSIDTTKLSDNNDALAQIGEAYNTHNLYCNKDNTSHTHIFAKYMDEIRELDTLQAGTVANYLVYPSIKEHRMQIDKNLHSVQVEFEKIQQICENESTNDNMLPNVTCCLLQDRSRIIYNKDFYSLTLDQAIDMINNITFLPRHALDMGLHMCFLKNMSECSVLLEDVGFIHRDVVNKSDIQKTHIFGKLRRSVNAYCGENTPADQCCSGLPFCIPPLEDVVFAHRVVANKSDTQKTHIFGKLMQSVNRSLNKIYLCNAHFLQSIHHIRYELLIIFIGCVVYDFFDLYCYFYCVH